MYRATRKFLLSSVAALPFLTTTKEHERVNHRYSSTEICRQLAIEYENYYDKRTEFAQNFMIRLKCGNKDGHITVNAEKPDKHSSVLFGNIFHVQGNPSMKPQEACERLISQYKSFFAEYPRDCFISISNERGKNIYSTYFKN